MTTTTATTTTLKDAVEVLGFDYANLGGHDRIGETQVFAARSCVDAEGRIFVSCGGEAILAFDAMSYGRRRTLCYLVRDSNDADTWTMRMRLDHGNDAMKACAAMGPRPTVRMRLAYPG